MRAVKLPLGERKRLEQLNAAAVAVLAIEPAACTRARRDDERSAAAAENIDIKFLQAETRLQQSAAGQGLLFIDREEPSPLMNIRRGFERRERIQISRVTFLWKERKADRQTVCWIQIKVEPRERIEAFEFAVAVCGRQACHFRAHKAVLETLEEECFVFLDRSANRETRSCRLHAVNMAVTKSRSHQHVSQQIAPFVCARACLDGGDG